MTLTCLSSLSNCKKKDLIKLFCCELMVLHCSEAEILTAISRHADIESPVPSICLRPKSFVSGRDFNSLSGTLFRKYKLTKHEILRYVYTLNLSLNCYSRNIKWIHIYLEQQLALINS